MAVRRSLTRKKRAPSQVSVSNYPCRFTSTICSDLRRNCGGDLRPVGAGSGTGDEGVRTGRVHGRRRDAVRREAGGGEGGERIS